MRSAALQFVAKAVFNWSGLAVAVIVLLQFLARVCIALELGDSASADRVCVVR